MRVLQRVGIMNRGGQETLWMNFLRNTRNSSLHMDFLVSESQKGAYDDEILALGSKVIYQGNCRNDGMGKWIDKYKIVSKTINECGKYDVFHINTYLALDALFDVWAAKKAGIKEIVVHSHNSDGPHKLVQKVLRIFLNRAGIKKVACSDKAAQWMFGTNKDVLIINNGIETSKYKMVSEKRLEYREALGIKDNEILIGHVGRFDEQKNHTFLIDIFAEVLKKNSNVKLVLVGQGQLEENIKEKVRRIGIDDKIIFYGTSNTVNEIMMAMDLFLFPSLYEGLPLVLVEAQASGLRIVCSETISKDTIITDLVTTVDIKKDASKWADIIESLLVYKRRDYSNEVYDKGFDIGYTISQVLDLYKEDDK